MPSPTAATLHATHYHDIDVFALQNELKGQTRGQLNDLLDIPVNRSTNWSEDDIQSELDTTHKVFLDIKQSAGLTGVGCSKVPDINDIGLMEDRATLRFHTAYANWLHHGITTEDQVMETLKRMAGVADGQNAGDALYENMAGTDNSLRLRPLVIWSLKARSSLQVILNLSCIAAVLKRKPAKLAK